MMGVAGWVPEIAPKVGPAFVASCPAGIFDNGIPRISCQRHDGTAGALPVVLLLHDSFGYAIKPYLYKHFRQAHLYWHPSYGADAKLIEELNPDVVVELLVERRILNSLPFHSNDWRNWLKRSLDSPPKVDCCWLNVVPNTKFFNVETLKQIDLGSVKPTTSRVYIKNRDVVKFTEASALWFDWYLLKSGDQGIQLADDASRRAYAQLQGFIAHGGHYELTSEFLLPNKDVLSLYKRKK
jgi:hypothetical protein